MLTALASGTLIADPKSRTSTNGKPFATCALRCPVEDAEAMVVSVIAFNADAVAALLALSKGDACAIAGNAKLAEWESAGKPRHGLSLVADRVLSVFAAGKARKAARVEESAPA